MTAQIDNLVALLEQWARWNAGYRLRIGYPQRSVGLAGYGGQTFDDMADESDAYQCRMIDAAIDDLIPAQAAAIHRRYLCAVYRMQRVSYEQALAEAHEALLVSLPRKGVCL